MDTAPHAPNFSDELTIRDSGNEQRGVHEEAITGLTRFLTSMCPELNFLLLSPWENYCVQGLERCDRRTMHSSAQRPPMGATPFMSLVWTIDAEPVRMKFASTAWRLSDLHEATAECRYRFTP